MCQGLPYWASGGPALLSPCNNYEIRCTENQDPPLYSYYADYTDCYGVLKRQMVSIGGVWGPRTVNVCSSTVPVPGQSTPPIFPSQVVVTAQGTCTNNTPGVSCGSTTSWNGGASYPNTYRVNLGSSTGIVTLSYNTQAVPDKIIVTWNGSVVINTGYRGNSDAQGQLNNSLAARGLPPELIVGPGIGTATFNKNLASNTYMDVNVYAPITDTVWTITASCPV